MSVWVTQKEGHEVGKGWEDVRNESERGLQEKYRIDMIKNCMHFSHN